MFDGLPALVARFGGGPAERCVSFAGHVDVVPAAGDWSSPPFSLSRHGDRVVGRGVCDMKAGVAASVGAIRALAASGLLEGCAVELVVTGDEEVGSARGMRSLLAAGLVRGKMAICGEPTSLDVYLGNRGVAWYEIVVQGRGGHAGQMHALQSPVPVAVDLCRAIGEMTFETVDERFDPPRPSIAVTRIDAGAATQAINVVPDAVTIGVDRRLLPAEAIDAATDELRGLVERTVRAPYRHEFRVLRRWPPCETPADHLISRAAVAAVQAVGRSGRFGMDLAANDSSFLVEAGIPALLLGPGRAGAGAHHGRDARPGGAVRRDRGLRRVGAGLRPPLTVSQDDQELPGEKSVEVDGNARQGNRHDCPAGEDRLVVTAIGLPAPGGQRPLVGMNAPDFEITARSILGKLGVYIVTTCGGGPDLNDQ